MATSTVMEAPNRASAAGAFVARLAVSPANIETEKAAKASRPIVSSLNANAPSRSATSAIARTEAKLKASDPRSVAAWKAPRTASSFGR